MELESKLAEARVHLENAIAEFKPKRVVTLVSGGNDSVTVTHFANRVLGERVDLTVHINTGIGIRQTREHVYELAERYGWRLNEYRAAENVNAQGEPDPMVYRDIVVKHGFPGPFAHRMMYSCLKERQIRRLGRDLECSASEPLMLISGVRREESTRRMGTTQLVARYGRFLWVSPFIDMTALDCNEYMTREGIPRNPVKDLLHMSGECLCGAFAKPGELKEIELWYPEAAAEIRDIEAAVRAAGHDWGWEDKPPRQRKPAPGQLPMEYLCVGCNKRDEEQSLAPVSLTVLG